MKIREAILKAADHIQATPEAFRYSEIAVPECGAPGCAIGWTAAFTGMSFRRTGAGLFPHHKPEIMRVHDDEGVCEKVFGCGHIEFYSRMSRLSSVWTQGAAECASALRLYANRFHPAKPVQQPPDWNAMAASRSALEQVER